MLFELGYAIAHRKRLWLLLNPRIGHARTQWDKFQLLTTVGFAPYNNSAEIVKRFYSEEPYKHLDQNLYDDLLKAAGPPSKKDALLYLRCDVNTEASMRLARRVSAGPIRSVIDDPQEIGEQPFAWYVQQVHSAFAVVCHLLSTEYQDWHLNNAKHALIAGLAYGRAKPLLMLAHEPYDSPLDYRDLLHKHRTGAAAESVFDNWLLSYIEQYETRVAQAAAYKVEVRAQSELRDITVGEPIAEHESESLRDYFVSTATFTETLHSRYSIVVGRKGTGKTATLFAITEDLRTVPRNHVCVIMPVAYELEGLLTVLREELSRAEQGYLVESFWKFLLYTELARSTYDQLLGKPGHYVRTEEEERLCEFAEQYQSLISPDFSSRLETIVSRLRDLSGVSPGESRRLRISELLHQDVIPRLRVLLGAVLKSRKKVTVLIDNLDKAWNPNADLSLLSDLLFGLLNVSRKVAEEFGRDASGRAPVNLLFALFLRSDIYAAMLQFAKEPDKLPTRLITWSDAALLKRVIEQRFMKSAADLTLPQDVWNRYFPATVAGIPTWEYLSDRILPRPRDLIYMVKSALQFAVNRGRTKVEEKDLVDGEKNYSRFATSSFIVEARVRIPNVDDLLVYFVRCPEIITEREILKALSLAGIPSRDLELVIALFAELTFLGFEVAPTRFEFLYEEQDSRRFLLMAKKTADESSGGVRRFRIHPAFQAFLEVEPHKDTTPGQMSMDL